MSGDSEDSLIETQTYDVTNTIAKVICCCTASSTLHLEPEEAVLEMKTCISHSTKRMPYGELGNVTHDTALGCCHSFNSNLSPEDDHGKKQPIAPGCGCEGAVVEEIVEQLRARMKGRGDTGNIKRAEEALAVMKRLAGMTSHDAAKLDALLGKMQVPIPSEVPVSNNLPAEEKTVFEHADYETTNCCFRVCTCGMGHDHLFLEPEEVVREVTDCCSASKQRRPYGELGSVDATRCCFCFTSVSTNFGALSPGCGCETDLVEEIAAELKQRMKARGDTGNIQRQEETIQLVLEVLKRVEHQDLRLNALMQQMSVPVPPPPAQQAMPKM